jgi:GNAT superfamily N-acetyltransferase
MLGGLVQAARMLYYRKLFPADRSRIVAHFLDLSPEDRGRRFRCPVSDDFIRSYCRTFCWSERAVIGAFRFDRLLGLAESVSLTPERAEIAVSVASPWRRHGIGRELVRRAAASAANHGAALAVLDYAPGDTSIPRLARSLGGSLDQRNALAMIPLPEPAHAIEIEELLEDIAAAAAWALDSVLWPFRLPGAAAS